MKAQGDRQDAREEWITAPWIGCGKVLAVEEM